MAGQMAPPLSIAHVTPYPWEAQEHEVNAYVRGVAGELSRRGHRVLILAPSRSQERVRASRRALRAAHTHTRGAESLLDGTDRGEPGVIAVGEALDVGFQSPTRPRPARALPIDVARTIEELLGAVPLDVVHVHEPFAGWVGFGTSNAALRHSRALNVGSFHAPTERLLSTLLARRFVETFFGRLDARTASCAETASLMERHFPAAYTLVPPADRGGERTWELVADELELLYGGLVARRRDPDGDPALRRRLSGRPTIDVDLHMHTDHSYDCATPVEVLLATAREQGLGAIAVTDHNEISGALEARAQADRFGPHPPVKVIVGEEVKTADEGEVIGLFIEERIPRGLTLARDRRGDRAPGRVGVRAAPLRPHARGPGLRAPAAGARRRSTRSRSSTRGSRSARSTRRRRASPPSTGSRPGPGRIRTSRGASARCGCGCATSTGRTSSCSPCATPRSSRDPRACCMCRR